MKQELLNKDVITEDMIYRTVRAKNFKVKSGYSFTDEYIESITSDERFINALMLNDNFIKNIKAIVGGMK